MAIISGSVVDNISGSPIENATVIIGNSLSLSNEGGFFSLDVPSGRHDLVVIQRYYKKIKEYIDIFGDTPLFIRMERE